MTHEALAIAAETYEAGDWRIARAENTRGACLAGRGRHAEAEPLLVDSYPVLRDAQGPRSPYARIALERVVSLYEAWGKPAKAAEYRALAPEPDAPRR
jgi:eukaryotic-like serine/threonine-protein kinase